MDFFQPYLQDFNYLRKLETLLLEVQPLRQNLDLNLKILDFFLISRNLDLNLKIQLFS